MLLNACYSRNQAELITRHIDCVVGMQQPIGDAAAIIFAASFYRATGFGRSVREAFELGVNALMLEGIPEDATPDLLTRDGVDAGDVVLVSKSEPPAAHPPNVSVDSAAGSSALRVWREKLDYLEEQEASLADPAQKFALRQQIAEAREKIKQLGG